MDFHTARDGEATGVWQLLDLQAAVDSGRVLPTDLIWTDRFRDWQPLHEVADEIGITLPMAEEDVPPIPGAELPAPNSSQITQRATTVAAPSRGFPWLRFGVSLACATILLSIVAAIALPAYRNYRERSLSQVRADEKNGANAPQKEWVSQLPQTTADPPSQVQVVAAAPPPSDPKEDVTIVDSTVMCVYEYESISCHPSFDVSEEQFTSLAGLAGEEKKKEIMLAWNDEVEGLEILFDGNAEDIYRLLGIDQGILRRKEGCYFSLNARLSITGIDYRADGDTDYKTMRVAVNKADVLKPLSLLPKSEQMNSDKECGP